MSWEYTITGYEYDELSDEAKKVAFAIVQEGLSAEPMEELIVEEMQRTINEAFGRDADDERLPDGLNLSYDIGWVQRAFVSLDGRLNRSDAPALPWPVSAQYAVFRTWSGDLTVHDEHGDELDEERYAALEEQMREVYAAAMKAGRDEWERQGSDEVVRDWMNDVGCVFYEDGKAIPFDVRRRGKAKVAS